MQANQGGAGIRNVVAKMLKISVMIHCDNIDSLSSTSSLLQDQEVKGAA